MKNLIRVLVLPVLFLVSSHACHAQMFLGDYPNNLRYYSAEIQIRYNNPGLVLPRSEFFSHKLDKGVSFLEDTLPKLVPGDYKYARVFDSVFTFDSSGLMKERKRFAQMANLPDGSVVQYGDVIRYIYVVPFSDEDFNFFFIIRYYNGRLNSVTVIDQHKKRDGMSTLWNGKEDVVLVGKNNSINPEDYPLQCLEYLLDYRRKEYQRLYKEPALAVAPPVQTGDTAKIATSGPGGAMWKQGKVIRFDTSGMKKDTVQRLTYFGLKLLNVSIPVSKKVEPVKYAFNLPKVKLEDDDILVPVDSQLLADVDAQIAENAKFLKEMKEESFANHRRRKEDRLISSISLASPATLSVVKPVMTNAKPISFNFKLPEIKIEEVLDTPSVTYVAPTAKAPKSNEEDDLYRSVNEKAQKVAHQDSIGNAKKSADSLAFEKRKIKTHDSLFAVNKALEDTLQARENRRVLDSTVIAVKKHYDDSVLVARAQIIKDSITSANADSLKNALASQKSRADSLEQANLANQQKIAELERKSRKAKQEVPPTENAPERQKGVYIRRHIVIQKR